MYAVTSWKWRRLTMYVYKPKRPSYVYLVSTADDVELPLGVFERLVEVANFVGCGWTTVYYMCNRGMVFRGMKVERVKLD